uniref:Uncharacterized protein n=1 Tax=Polytomella parva TaxID=51329 RepID=A0A7S0UJU6_9CHLO|mmetsp:Transcript_11872/g.21302  ORF Transcript_11872/g.21302 Transcript_11872/m.21302 type:complete len:193 (+) Transcript_11872:75-653(+)
MKFKKDFQLDSELPKDINPDTLKVGSLLGLKKNEDSTISIYTQANEKLGSFPEDFLSSRSIDEIKISLRSFKKNSETKTLTSVLLRLEEEIKTAVENINAKAQVDAASAELDEEDGLLLQKSQLNRLRGDPSLVNILKDERLQRLLIEIDSSDNREQFLDSVLKSNNAFQKFADKVLVTIDPDRFSHLQTMP